MDAKPLQGPTALTILSGQTTTTASVPTARAHSLTVYAPAVLTGTLTVQARADKNSPWCNHQSGGSDITLTQGKSCSVYPIPSGEIQLVSSSAEGADRTILVQLRVE